MTTLEASSPWSSVTVTIAAYRPAWMYSWQGALQVGCAASDPYLNPETRVSTEAELQAELERLKAENAALRARGSRSVSMKVSEKGAVSVYGLGRFPVTLYQEQWLKLLDMADDIRRFIKENEGRLKKKE